MKQPMFTGIIEEIGTARRIVRQGESLRMTIEASRVLEDVHIGDSIAVNGVCLTVVTFDSSSMAVDVVPETFRRSALKVLGPGDPVNLERAMAANSRFGGHIVQGHVDSIGIITSRMTEHNAVIFHIRPELPDAMRYIVSKGSIAIDGISLTVADVTETSFAVSIIPHTLSQTTLINKKPGHSVNLETDIIGKYVEKLLLPHQHDRAGRGITEKFLYDNGFV